jgi:Bacterial PH domain
VMRVGIVLSVTFNLPYRAIEAAGLKTCSGGMGDIPLSLGGKDRIAWMQLWPHARPWRLKKPEPMLRSVPDATRVAALLAQAWSTERQLPATEPAAARPLEAAPAARHGALPAGLRVAR